MVSIDTVRASRAGHTFHERWTARRALQLIFPKDDLFAIAVEGLSTNETAEPGDEAEDIADLMLYFGQGDTFQTSRALQTIQFKYKADAEPVTSSYLKKTIKKFAATILGYEKDVGRTEIDTKLTFSFVTNTDFSEPLWEAVRCLGAGSKPNDKAALAQYENLKKWCEEVGLEADRLFPVIEFRAASKDLPTQNRNLHKTLSDWTPGVDSQARTRLHGLEELIREKAGLSGQRNNLVKREDVLDSLGCDPEDLFPANTEFVDIGIVIEREALCEASNLIESATPPVFIYADGGVGKTVFIQSLAHHMGSNFETVIFDCFGGGSYRAVDQARHLPKNGLLQIVNELASRGLCDPQLPSDGDRYALIKAARKRLEQVVKTVRMQSAKSGVLVIIDAADNAQLEAEQRKEDAFPKLLLANLSRDPVDGVKLVLTARPHRMDGVIGKNKVVGFKLCSFSTEETRSFLESRRENLTKLEFSTSLVRSVGNARVLDYLVTSWDENISGSTSREVITVEELIIQRCTKIRDEFHLAGWGDEEIKQFFVAISLLPPPIPLNEMASALGWQQSKINSAVADLAPMFELLKHGAIFRDEPTETFIRETYAIEKQAQQDIAGRLYACQAISSYAAEALPHFLVVINDAQRAYTLSTSVEYPASIQSEYGRRRLRLLRLRAAFSLAVKARDHDRVLRLTMQLAQVAAANAKGDQFLRRLPGVSVCLGDQDASRRLFQDRSGWRGARDARLAVSFVFQEEMEEAYIHQNRTVGWINWYYQSRQNDERMGSEGPSDFDFASVVFLRILKGDYSRVDSNIAKWNFHFSLGVCRRLILLAEQYEKFHGIRVLTGLVKFASSKNCQSLALQVTLLASKRCLDIVELKQLSRATSTSAKNTNNDEFDNGHDYKNEQLNFLCDAALSALIYGSRQSALNIIRTTKDRRITSYDYGDRHGSFRAWGAILSSCVGAWSAGEKLRFHHMLPSEVQVNRTVKTIKKCSELSAFLGDLMKVPSSKLKSEKGKGKPEKLFSNYDCENIIKGIQLINVLAEPLQTVVLSRRLINALDFHYFVEQWKTNLRFSINRHAENAQDVLGRHVGLGFATIFLQHATSVDKDDCQTLTDLLRDGRFTIPDKLDVLSLMARHDNLHEQTGLFAREISEDIRKDEYIDQRAEHYSRLSEALLPISIAEARQYFREGLSQLDQLGGDDYDFIYSLLRYAAEQNGGWLQPALGHRLMNLCQTIFHYEPDKFGWTLFGKAAAQSIGYQALFKLLRWADQDVSDFSYGLPQLICYLAKEQSFDARRATFLLLLCEDHGWYEWKIGDGLKDILEVANEADRPVIFQAIYSKLKLEYPFGGSESLWQSLLDTTNNYPGIADQSDLNTLKLLGNKGRSQQEDEDKSLIAFNFQHQSGENPDDKDKEKKTEEAFKRLVDECCLDSPHSIDAVILIVREDRKFMFHAGKRVVNYLRDLCPYDGRTKFINMLAELVELDFDDAIEAMKDCVELWEGSSAHISSGRKDFIRKIFEVRGTELFDQRYTGVLRKIQHLIAFCSDGNFVLDLVLDTLAKEKVELSGDEWLQLATSLCPYASNEANLGALEDLLSGPAAKIGDEVGEGSFKSAFLPIGQQSSMVAGITWHLLGNAKTFVRWTTARCIKSFADLGLHDDLNAMLGYFDRAKVDTLVSEDMDSSFLNAGQWLLMGLARACYYHGTSLIYLHDRLEILARRNDIHVINKLHVLRCLKSSSACSTPSLIFRELEEEIFSPAKGYVVEKGWPKPVDSKTGFCFDYEFIKHEVSSLATLFGISEGEATDAIAAEIHKRWPDAKDMDYFLGHERFSHTHSEQYESYRDSVQRHSLLHAATTLAHDRAVIRNRYEPNDTRPWVDWLQQHDVTFDDGRWLVDRKDCIPEQAKEIFVARSEGAEALDGDETLLRKLGMLTGVAEPFVPICGDWKSGDGVRVHISSALAPRKGIIGICKELSRESNHDIWLPTFGSDGESDRHMIHNKFEPLIWVPEKYPIGIDSGDELATRYSAERARLGRALTERLGLKSNQDFQEWFTQDGRLVLGSQVWGQWRQEPSDQRTWYQDGGRILRANSMWLDSTLSTLNQTLVLHIDFHKHKSYRSYDNAPGLRAVYICLLQPGGKFRYWKAKRASKTTY